MGIFHKKHARVKHRPRRHRIRAYRMLGRYTRFPIGLRHIEKLEIEQFSYEHREQVESAYPNLTADFKIDEMFYTLIDLYDDCR